MWRPHYFVLTECLDVYRRSLHVVMLIATGARCFSAQPCAVNLASLRRCGRRDRYLNYLGRAVGGNEKCMWISPASAAELSSVRAWQERGCGSYSLRRMTGNLS